LDHSTQRSIAAMHACVVAAAVRQRHHSLGAPLPDHLTSPAHQQSLATAAEHSSFSLAAQVLSIEQGALPACLNFEATGALLHQLNFRLLEIGASGITPTLTPASPFTPFSPPGTASTGVDISAPCLQEAALAVEPVTKLLVGIDKLLERFEEQPMLLQLRSIADRILRACQLASAN
jgi:hypothetical protein